MEISGVSKRISEDLAHICDSIDALRRGETHATSIFGDDSMQRQRGYLRSTIDSAASEKATLYSWGTFIAMTLILYGAFYDAKIVLFGGIAGGGDLTNVIYFCLLGLIIFFAIKEEKWTKKHERNRLDWELRRWLTDGD